MHHLTSQARNWQKFLLNRFCHSHGYIEIHMFNWCPGVYSNWAKIRVIDKIMFFPKVELGSKTWPFFRNFSISKFSNHFSATRPVMRAALTDRKLQFHSPMPRSINLCHENCIAPRFGSRKKMMWCVSVRKLYFWEEGHHRETIRAETLAPQLGNAMIRTCRTMPR